LSAAPAVAVDTVVTLCGETRDDVMAKSRTVRNELRKRIRRLATDASDRARPR
jgi:hypothetical protein